MVLTFLRRACAVAFCTLSSTQIEAAERLISTNLDTRTVLAFRVSNEAVRKLLPAGRPMPPIAAPRAMFIARSPAVRESSIHCAASPGSACALTTGGGFHLPVSASDLGA